ncbi:MAG: hypothetical protein F6J90_27165 [Moorea sp. SIOASIH]|uniref:hypothetical protein n=1 Tax=Moorena sp. SIOASIH TaxID=2607817 RepID=UPI0013BC0E8E|nr:hypothetical protein [Moorena sp. SIOASIH]NEO39812.1 hypothetical protein [Moorena sp. SIOASIH]NEO90387.1 hypothetical protein [Moorena sp. SIO3G5]
MGILISKAGGFGRRFRSGDGTDLILPRQPDFTHTIPKPLSPNQSQPISLVCRSITPKGGSDGDKPKNHH